MGFCEAIELRSVIHPQIGALWVDLEQLLDRDDLLCRPTAPADPNRQAEPAVLVDDIEEFESPPIRRLVELEVVAQA